MPDLQAMRIAVVEYFKQYRTVTVRETESGIEARLESPSEDSPAFLLIGDELLLKAWPEGVPDDVSEHDVNNVVTTTRAGFEFVSEAHSQDMKARSKERQQREEQRRRSLRLYHLTADEMARVDACCEPFFTMERLGYSEEEADKQFMEFQKKAYRDLQSPAELHFCVLSHNFDDGEEYLTEMLQRPELDMGTALSLFWGLTDNLLEPASEVAEWNRPVYDLTLNLLSRLSEGFYKGKQFRFQPDPNIVSRTDLAYPIPDSLRKSIKGKYDGVYHPEFERDV